MSSIRIGLLGHFGSGNLGNEASLRAMLELLRRNGHSSNISVICYGVEEVQREHAVRAIGIRYAPGPRLARFAYARWLRLPLRAIDVVRATFLARTFDVVLVPGTGILDDFQENWYGSPFYVWMWSLALKLSRRPLALVCIGAGPISGSMSARLLLGAASMASYRSYRDEISKEFMIERRVHARGDPVVADIAFLLAPPEGRLRAHSINARKTIGIGLMSYRGWEHASPDGAQTISVYLDKIVQFSCWLLDNGYRIRFLIGEYTDAPVVEEAVKRIRLTRTFVEGEDFAAEPTLTLEALMEQMAETEVVVATRYHNIVAALLMHKPALSISYARKNGALLADAGLAEFQQGIETLNVDLLIDQFRKLMDKKEDLIASVEAAANQYRSRLAQQEAELVKRLVSGNWSAT